MGTIGLFGLILGIVSFIGGFIFIAYVIFKY